MINKKRAGEIIHSKLVGNWVHESGEMWKYVQVTKSGLVLCGGLFSYDDWFIKEKKDESMVRK